MDSDYIPADTPRSQEQLRPYRPQDKMTREEREAMEQIVKGVLAKQEGSWEIKK